LPARLNGDASEARKERNEKAARARHQHIVLLHVRAQRINADRPVISRLHHRGRGCSAYTGNTYWYNHFGVHAVDTHARELGSEDLGSRAAAALFRAGTASATGVTTTMLLYMLLCFLPYVLSVFLLVAGAIGYRVWCSQGDWGLTRARTRGDSSAIVLVPGPAPRSIRRTAILGLLFSALCLPFAFQGGYECLLVAFALSARHEELLSWLLFVCVGPLGWLVLGTVGCVSLGAASRALLKREPGVVTRLRSMATIQLVVGGVGGVIAGVIPVVCPDRSFTRWAHETVCFLAPVLVGHAVLLLRAVPVLAGETAATRAGTEPKRRAPFR
jgi:hypothetical protein